MNMVNPFLLHPGINQPSVGESNLMMTADHTQIPRLHRSQLEKELEVRHMSPCHDHCIIFCLDGNAFGYLGEASKHDILGIWKERWVGKRRPIFKNHSRETDPCYHRYQLLSHMPASEHIDSSSH